MIHTDMAVYDHSGESNQIVNGLYGPRVHPAAIGLAVSPCKRRPDRGEPCPLASRTKFNSECPVCSWRLGKPGKPFEILEAELAAGEISFYQTEDGPTTRTVVGRVSAPPRRTRERPVCGWPGCGKVLFSGQWCKLHGETYRRRLNILRGHFGRYADPAGMIFIEGREAFKDAIEVEKRRRGMSL